MQYGYVKSAAVSPGVCVADCVLNEASILKYIRMAADSGVEIACLPELCLTGASCGDLFLQKTLQDQAVASLKRILVSVKDIRMIFTIGLPIAMKGKLYNCMAVCQNGRLLGMIPKRIISSGFPFAAAREKGHLISFAGQEVPFGTDLIFQSRESNGFSFAVVFGDELRSPVSPIGRFALAGAELLLCPSAAPELIDSYQMLRTHNASLSAQFLCSIVESGSCAGESTTDYVYSGRRMIVENGTVTAESALFHPGITVSDLDIELIRSARQRNDLFTEDFEENHLFVDFDLPVCSAPLDRKIARSPFVPDDPEACRRQCSEILSIQAEGLKKRMEHTHAKSAVLGISGGLDSTLALLVTVKAFQKLGKPLTDIIAVTMPCFGTTRRTRSNAERLCNALGVTLQEINITETVRSNFNDIGQNESIHDVTFENTQARVRTLVLMNLANRTGGMVIGTGDLSELALGWATYNGDHMSMYGVNASVPKTLLRHIVSYAAYESPNALLKQVLKDILDTPVSPELLPAENGEISQQTEELVGPYELHDFFMYYSVHYGFAPDKIYWMAKQAFEGSYPDEIILHWLKNFYRRFFAQQFKRSCLPDGPAVGAISFSPRCGLKMPSDACSAAWIAEAEMINKQID